MWRLAISLTNTASDSIHNLKCHSQWEKTMYNRNYIILLINVTNIIYLLWSSFSWMSNITFNILPHFLSILSIFICRFSLVILRVLSHTPQLYCSLNYSFTFHPYYIFGAISLFYVYQLFFIPFINLPRVIIYRFDYKWFQQRYFIDITVIQVNNS